MLKPWGNGLNRAATSRPGEDLEQRDGRRDAQTRRLHVAGHSGTPDEDVRRRFDRGREHFETLYKPLVDAWMLYDNSGEAPMLIDSGSKP